MLFSLHTTEFALFSKVHIINFWKFFSSVYLFAQRMAFINYIIWVIVSKILYGTKLPWLCFIDCSCLFPPRMIRYSSNLRALPLGSTYCQGYAGVSFHHLPELIMSISSQPWNEWHHGGSLKLAMAQIFTPWKLVKTKSQLPPLKKVSR